MTKQADNTEAKQVEVKQAPKKQAVPEQPKETSIYVGPTLRGGRLARYTIFKDGELLPNIADIANEHKAVKSLIVPVSRLADVEKRLQDPSSLESLRYKEAAKLFSKGDQ